MLVIFLHKSWYFPLNFMAVGNFFMFSNSCLVNIYRGFPFFHKILNAGQGVRLIAIQILLTCSLWFIIIPLNGTYASFHTLLVASQAEYSPGSIVVDISSGYVMSCLFFICVPGIVDVHYCFFPIFCIVFELLVLHRFQIWPIQPLWPFCFLISKNT